MSVRNQLLALQWAQLKHDEAYHKDVVILPPAQRITHMALHNAKYTAYFLDAVGQGNAEYLTRTLTDAFVIVLASANTLNQDLGRELDETGAIPSLHELGADLAVRLPYDATDPIWIVRQFVRHNGQLAKVCESWDHLEAIPFRDSMMNCNRALLRAVLAEAAIRGLELVEAYRTRIRAVERRSIFNSKFRESAGGEA